MAKKRDLDEFRGGIQNKKKAVVIIVVIVAAITTVSLTALSFESVDFNEYALLQNTLTREIDDVVYEAGFHYTGVFASFIKFDNTWQTIEFSPHTDADDIPVTASTNDGFQIIIDISFQFRVEKDNLLALYSAHKLEYKAFYMQEARSTIRHIAAQYNASEFYTNRATIDTALGEAMHNKSTLFMAEIGQLQLRQVDLPSDIDAALQEIFLQQLQLEIAELERQEAIIDAETAIIEAYASANQTLIAAYAAAEAAIIAAYAEANQTIIAAYAAANATVTEAEALAMALNITITQEGLALFDLANSTGFNTTELLMYLWIQAIEMHDSAYIILSGDTPFILDYGT